jgi:hypothetical protein
MLYCAILSLGLLPLLEMCHCYVGPLSIVGHVCDVHYPLQVMHVDVCVKVLTPLVGGGTPARSSLRVP